VNYEIVEIQELSGNQATIYSVYIDDDSNTLFDQFAAQYQNEFRYETKDILIRLKTIGNKTGAREIYFKHAEGAPGDGVCALYDRPNSVLRMYCIRYGNNIIILGSGGPKSKEIKSWQEDETLSLEASRMIQISKIITNKIIAKEIYFSPDNMRLMGELNFNEDDQ
jgi:hypothetical protein